MKSRRHKKIIELVEENIIETQEDLADALKKEGFAVTQATVSRDIRELQLIKVAAGDNRYRYAAAVNRLPAGNQSRVKRILQDSMVRLDYSENIIVVKTTPGAAQSVALVIDNEDWKEIIGTVAGDDTVLVVIKPKAAVPDVLKKLSSYMA